MRDLWESLLACLPPSWRRLPDPARREAVLKVILVVAICLCAGPEMVAAIELQILLELLGPVLFMTAFFAGAKLLFMSLVERLRSILVPAAPAALIFVAYLDGWLASAAT